MITKQKSKAGIQLAFVNTSPEVGLLKACLDDHFKLPFFLLKVRFWKWLLWRHLVVRLRFTMYINIGNIYTKYLNKLPQEINDYTDLLPFLWFMTQIFWTTQVYLCVIEKFILNGFLYVVRRLHATRCVHNKHLQNVLWAGKMAI